MTAATVVDIRTRRIPNELTATLAGIGLGLSAAGVSGISVWASMLGFVVGLALMMPGHVLGATGAVSGMPGFGEVLSQSEIEAVLDYIASHWSERARAYQAEVTRQAEGN